MELVYTTHWTLYCVVCLQFTYKYICSQKWHPTNTHLIFIRNVYLNFEMFGTMQLVLASYCTTSNDVNCSQYRATLLIHNLIQLSLRYFGCRSEWGKNLQHPHPLLALLLIITLVFDEYLIFSSTWSLCSAWSSSWTVISLLNCHLSWSSNSPLNKQDMYRYVSAFAATKTIGTNYPVTSCSR